MKVEYINPFVESVTELFRTMLNAKVTRGTVHVSNGIGEPRNVIALIGITGSVRGTVALHLPVNTALKMVNILLGTDHTTIDQTVADGVSEVVNIIAGGAKAKFPQANEKPLKLSLPTLVRGNNVEIDYPSKSVWLDVPFSSDLGPFSLRVTFEEDGSQ